MPFPPHRLGRFGRAPLVAALLVAGLACGTLGGARVASAAPAPAPAPNPADEELDRLSLLYEAAAQRVEPEAYEEQRDVLARIADVNTPAARRRLDELLLRHGPGSPMRAVQLLGAIARRGGPKEIDAVVRWIEERNDDLLLAMLPVILERALGDAAGRHMREVLVRRATPPVRAEVVRALGRRRDGEAFGMLLRQTREGPIEVRLAAIEALGALGDGRARQPIEWALQDADPRMRDMAAQALEALGGTESSAVLCRHLQDEDRRVVESVALALGRVGDREAIPGLLDALARFEQGDLRLADAVVGALRRLSGKHIAPDAELWRAWWVAVKDRPNFRDGDWEVSSSDPGPRYHDTPIRSSRVVFVLDVSRSMGWNRRLDSAKDELIRTLESLDPSVRFNLIAFEDRSFVWKPKMVEASRGNVASAARFIRSQTPGNGTNTHGALAKAFHEDDVDTVFLLSDGHPSVGMVVDGEMIRMAVQRWNRWRRVRLHAIALLRGEPPAAFAGRENPTRAGEFLSRLAEENHGEYRLVD